MVEVSPEFLISGKDYLAQHPGFKMIGRTDDLKAALGVLLGEPEPETSSGLVLYGEDGTGISSLIRGILASKKKDGAPEALVRKSFYFLDVDALLASGDDARIKEGFQKAMKTLAGIRNPVLVIEDAKNFLDGIENKNIINALMHETKTNPNFQVILAGAENDVPGFLQAHSEIRKNFTFQSVGEPSKEDLRAIVENAAAKMGRQYGVTVAKEAIDSALELPAKHAVQGLPAQPKRSVLILRNAIRDYSLAAQMEERPSGLDKLEETLAKITAAEAGKATQTAVDDMSPEDLSGFRRKTEDDIANVTQEWKGQQEKLQKYSVEMDAAEQAIRSLTAQIAAQKEKENAAKKAFEDAVKEYKEAGDDKDMQFRIKDAYKNRYHEPLIIPEEKPKTTTTDFNAKLSAVTPSAEARRLEGDRKAQQTVFDENKTKYEAQVKEINDSKKDAAKKDLVLTDTQVLAEFSRLSNIDLTKLNQGDRERLLGMESELESKIFGQPQAVKAVVKAVQRGTVFRKKKDKPKGSFFFVGPSGVGKTELAKVLAAFLYGSEDALFTLNMPEYNSESDASKLLGPSPGLVGYDAGGVLTNCIFQQPARVILFDEIEKGNVNIFDPLMRVVDEGRVQDNHGRTATFGETILIFTSNIGSKYFLEAPNTKEGFEEACRKAKEDLVRHVDPETGKEVGLRPEFLNRFGEDNIIFFNRLDNGQIVLVAEKYLKACNEQNAAQGITIEMGMEDKEAMVAEKYKPALGARVIELYIDNAIGSDVAETLLREPDKKGVMKVTYTPTAQLPEKDREAKNPPNISTRFIEEGTQKPAPQAAANSNARNIANPAVGQ